MKSWPDLDEAFLDTVRKIKSVLAVLGEKTKPTLATPVTPKARPAIVVDSRRSANLTVRKEFTEADKDDFLVKATEPDYRISACAKNRSTFEPVTGKVMTFRWRSARSC